MHGIPAIGIRVADLKNPEDSVEMDVLIGKRIDLDMLRYVPDIAENWQAQQMIAALIHDMPEAQTGLNPGIRELMNCIRSQTSWKRV